MKIRFTLLVLLLFPFIISFSQSIDISKKIKDMNKLSPMRVGKITTFIGATYIGNTIQYNFMVEDEYIPLIDEKEYKTNTLNNLINSESDAAFQYFINKRIYMNHAIWDTEQNLRFIIKISPEDLKTVYNKKRK